MTDARCTLALPHASAAARMRNNAGSSCFAGRESQLRRLGSGRQKDNRLVKLLPPHNLQSQLLPHHYAHTRPATTTGPAGNVQEMPGLSDASVGRGRDLRHVALRTDTLWQLSTTQRRSLIQWIVCQSNNDDINPRTSCSRKRVARYSLPHFIKNTASLFVLVINRV